MIGKERKQDVTATFSISRDASSAVLSFAFLFSLTHAPRHRLLVRIEYVSHPCGIR